MNAYSMLPWYCVHGSGEKDWQDEGDGANLVLQSKERTTKHDVSVNKCMLRLKHRQLKGSVECE